MMEQPNDGVNADAKSTQPSIMPHITETNAPALESSALSSPRHPSPIIGPTNADDGDDDVEDHATVLALMDFQREIMGTLNPPAATDGDTRELPLPSHSVGGDDVTEPPPKCDDGAGPVVDPAIVVTNANADGIPLRERDSDLPSSSSAIQDDQRVSARDYLTALEKLPPGQYRNLAVAATKKGRARQQVFESIFPVRPTSRPVGSKTAVIVSSSSSSTTPSTTAKKQQVEENKQETVTNGAKADTQNHGISNEAKAYLTQWLSDHASHPYPQKAERHEIMQQFGIADARKLQGWFQRARTRMSKANNVPIAYWKDNTHNIISESTHALTSNTANNLNTNGGHFSIAKEDIVEGADLLSNLFFTAPADATDNNVGRSSATGDSTAVVDDPETNSYPTTYHEKKNELQKAETMKEISYNDKIYTEISAVDERIDTLKNEISVYLDNEEMIAGFDDSDDENVAEFMREVLESKDNNVVDYFETEAMDIVVEGGENGEMEGEGSLELNVSPQKRQVSDHINPPKCVYPEPPIPTVPFHELYSRPRLPTATEYNASMPKREDKDPASAVKLPPKELSAKPSSTIAALAALEESAANADVNSSAFVESCGKTELPQARYAAISSDADSVAVAAMMMTGSRTTSPTIDPINAVAGHDAFDPNNGGGNQADEVAEEQSQRTVSPPNVDTEALKLPAGCVLRFIPEGKKFAPANKQQVKFNLNGIVVQVPSDILLRQKGSRLAEITRSAIRALEMTISLPRDYELFCHVVYFISNGKVTLPPPVRREKFLNELEYYGIPFDQTHVSGGQITNPIKGHPTVTPAESKAGVSQVKGKGVSQLDLLASAMSSLASPAKYGGSTNDHTKRKAAIGEPTEPFYQSPLDLLSSAIFSATDGVSYANHQGSNFKMKKHQHMCGKCDVCLREDCGECVTCLDKSKFGGPNRMRKKCILRRCPYILPLSDAMESPSDRAMHMEQSERSNDARNVKKSISYVESWWNKSLELLRPCIEVNGMMNYLVIPDEEIRNQVRGFVKDCRKQYRRFQDNLSTSMSIERISLLEAMNFSWTHIPYVGNYVSKKPVTNTATTSLDLLLSVTSQSYDEARSLMDDDDDNDDDDDDVQDDDDDDVQDDEDSMGKEEADDEEDETREPSRRQRKSINRGMPVVIMKRAVICGKCTNCKRDDCGTCKACIDKPKFGGPNKMKQKCYCKICHHMMKVKPSDKNEAVVHGTTVSRKGPRKPGPGLSEEERMMSELANIRAELDAKAQNIKYGLRGPKIISTPSIASLAREIEAQGSDDDSSIRESSSEEDNARRKTQVSFSGDMATTSTVEQVGNKASSMFTKREGSQLLVAATTKAKSKRTDIVRAPSESKKPLWHNIFVDKVEAQKKTKKRMFKPPKDSTPIACTVKAKQTTKLHWKCSQKLVLDASGKLMVVGDVYTRAKKLADSLPRGITLRPSGKWQVQVYYAGKSRYIGVFETKIDAAVAYELARDCVAQFKEDIHTSEQAQKNIVTMRKAAFAPFLHEGNDQQAFPEPTIKKSNAIVMATVSVKPTTHRRPPQDVQDRKRPSPSVTANAARVEPKRPRTSKEESVPRTSTFIDFPEIGKGWKKESAPRPSMERDDYYYYSPTGERFRSLKQAKRAANRKQNMSREEVDDECGGKQRTLTSGVKRPTTIATATTDFAVGFKFQKQFIDDDGNDLGWFDGEIVELTPQAVPTKYRCVFYTANNGLGEELSHADIEKCIRAEERKKRLKRRSVGEGAITQADIDAEDETFGAVGYSFKRMFDGVWFDGVVVKILDTDALKRKLKKAANDVKDRRCHYPADDDFEDLTLNDLRREKALYVASLNNAAIDETGESMEASPRKRKRE